SRQDTKTPVKIGIRAMLANMVFNLALVVPFHFFWQIGHVGLALATSASAFLNAGWLLAGLKRSGVYLPRQDWLKFLALLGAASGLMGVYLSVCLYYLPDFTALVWWVRLLHVAWLCATGFLIYVLVLLTGGWRPRHLRPD